MSDTADDGKAPEQILPPVPKIEPAAFIDIFEGTRSDDDGVTTKVVRPRQVDGD